MELRGFEPPNYIELITRAAGITDPAEIRRHVEARTRRQAILTRHNNPCQLHAIIDENALARITDPAIRRHQAAHLSQAASRPTITVQILPVSAGAYPVTSEASLHLAFPDGERDIVYIEATTYPATSPSATAKSRSRHSDPGLRRLRRASRRH